MSEFQEFLKEQLEEDEFWKEWEDIQPEMDVIRTMADRMGMTLKLEFVPKSSIKNLKCSCSLEE